MADSTTDPFSDPGGAPGPVIDTDLVRCLVAEQFPDWAGLPVRRVEVDGVDNRTFRLGEQLSVRLPSAERYRLQVAKEQRWLPLLGPRLPLPVPQPVAHGAPGCGYPFGWSVNRWLVGQTAASGRIADLSRFAADVGRFLLALRALDPAGGPPPGPHNFFRGGAVATYADETLAAIGSLGNRIPRQLALDTWQAAIDAGWDGEPVWVHGDVAVGNLLVRDGRLSAVLDFGGLAVGDPACDTVLGWTLFDGPSRAVWREVQGVDDATWARGRGWALWKSLISLDAQLAAGTPDAADTRAVLDRVLSDATAA